MKKIIVHNEYIELNNVMVDKETDIEIVKDWLLDLDLVICDLKNKLTMIKEEVYQENFIDSREFAKIRAEVKDAVMLRQCIQRQIARIKAGRI